MTKMKARFCVQLLSLLLLLFKWLECDYLRRRESYYGSQAAMEWRAKGERGDSVTCAHAGAFARGTTNTKEKWTKRDASGRRTRRRTCYLSMMTSI